MICRSRFRHAPGERAELVAVMTEARDREGRTYFFAFAGGRKLFMVKDRARPNSWRLYSQPLGAPKGAEALPEAEAPTFARLAEPDPPREFVSGLPDTLLPDRRGDDGHRL